MDTPKPRDTNMPDELTQRHCGECYWFGTNQKWCYDSQHTAYATDDACPEFRERHETDTETETREVKACKTSPN